MEHFFHRKTSVLRAFLQLIKTDRWWVYKIAGGLLTVLVVTIAYQVSVNALFWIKLAVLFVSFGLLAVFGHLLNDYTDQQTDRLAGKSNAVTHIGSRTSLILISTLSITALLLLSVLESKLLLALGGLQILLNMAYSVRPFRIKEKGIWAILITGVYERVLPYFMIGCLLVDIEEMSMSDMFVGYLLWAFFWEMRNFLNGQQQDMEADRATGQKTVAVVFKADFLVKLNWLFFVVEVAAFGLWFFCFPYALFALVPCVVVGVYFYQKKTGGYRITPPQMFRFTDNLYTLTLPVSFATYAVVLYTQQLWPMLAVLFLGFNNQFRTLCLIGLRTIRWYGVWRALTFPYRMVSLAFNWSLYYFRKWVLNWSEERNWGKHYSAHLERQEQKKRAQMPKEENRNELE